jgi:hypothetical protein
MKKCYPKRGRLEFRFLGKELGTYYIEDKYKLMLFYLQLLCKILFIILILIQGRVPYSPPPLAPGSRPLIHLICPL